ncbi:MAG TPA: IPT/TIG domain-containing protein [Planctomycetota bacterium]|nr:IPT/TIG domain-containing protein [Planctomycetota bacterium]
MRRPPLLLALLLLPACSPDYDFVRPVRFAVAGEPAEGQTIVQAGPTMQITVKMESDSTDFDPTTVLRLVVNGVDRTADMTIGGEYAILTLDPPPIGTPQVAEVYQRTGDLVLDTATYEATPYTGPLLLGVTPDTAEAGAEVTISGLGFAAGAVRVFFGGVEGAVTSSTDTAITATVPTGAVPGLLFVLVGDDTAVGLVPFLPVDGTGTPLPKPKDTWIFYVAPARGPRETVCTVAGLNFDEDAVSRVDNVKGTRAFNIQTVNFPLVGDVVTGYAVVSAYVDPGPTTFELLEHDDSNDLPFTVE